MDKTPKSNRQHIGLYGKRNVGKSSLMNSILNQKVSLVSDIKGTTTDPVSKAMELVPIGPVLFIDTGGLDDTGKLGQLRVKKTKDTIKDIDLALYVIDATDYKDEYLEEMLVIFKAKNIPYIIIINKKDKIDNNDIEEIKSYYDEELIFTSVDDKDSMTLLENEIKNKLYVEKESKFLEDLIPYNGKVILVIDNDSAAPKGRLILPQVQILRDALDNGIKSYVVRNSELESALLDMDNIDLVITDSKIFSQVDKKIDGKTMLTSFSILMAREKGDLELFYEGVKSLEKLKNKERPKILIAEACTHATTHEDIGQVKIPRMIENYLDKQVEIIFKSGGDFAVEDDIDLVIHCGACMLNKRNMISRINECIDKDIAITNYGIFISFMLGILDRAVEIFDL